MELPKSAPSFLPERSEAGPYKTKQYKGKAKPDGASSISLGASAAMPNPMKKRVAKSKKRF